MNCFYVAYLPVPRRGFTPVEAAEFLKREFPDASQWTCWDITHTPHGRAVGKIVGKGDHKQGKVGGWTWTRVPCSYPEFALWDGYDIDPAKSDDWVGTLRVEGATGETFMLFSFLNSLGCIGQWYMASTLDVALLDRFAQDVHRHFHPPQKLTVHVRGGPTFSLELSDEEKIFLPPALREDIERQVFSFFQNAGDYERLRLRHRRGFLFVGPPGTGKTLLLRHLVRQCHVRFRVTAFMLTIAKDTRDDDVIELFQSAARCTPALIMLEDLDSLTQESRVSRANLLAQLDGLEPKSGLLVIGSTNHPGDVDPALVHRPSRFDRVWHFPLPNLPMRREYLAWAFDGLDDSTVDRLARNTGDWSFAYLNELRTTAAILAMERTPLAITSDLAERAHDLLAAQFDAGKKNHIAPPSDVGVGFRAA
jgi:hypothetical protein